MGFDEYTVMKPSTKWRWRCRIVLLSKNISQDALKSAFLPSQTLGHRWSVFHPHDFAFFKMELNNTWYFGSSFFYLEYVWGSAMLWLGLEACFFLLLMSTALYRLPPSIPRWDNCVGSSLGWLFKKLCCNKTL